MMVIRKFKPGDWVQHKMGGPVMEVIRYEADRNLLIGEILNDEDVFCEWYEIGERMTGVFNQRALKKSSKDRGLFKI